METTINLKMENNNSFCNKWPQITIQTPLGELVATANPDLDYPEIYTFLRRTDGLEIDLATVTIDKEKNESHIYVYDDTSIESPTKYFIISKNDLMIDKE